MLTALAHWQSFYSIIGSAAAALTGLMFITITLVAGIRQQRSGESIGAFGTPTLLHFCAALFIAAVLNVPWSRLWHASLPLGAVGLAGVIYVSVVARRLSQPTTYQPVLEDWMWHAILPFVAYAVLLASAILLSTYTTLALFGIGAISLLFLFIGIHNAWDTVTFIAIQYARSQE